MVESPLSLNAIEYTFRHLLKVAFPQLESEPFRVEKGDGSITVFVKEVRLVIYTISRRRFGYLCKGRMLTFLKMYNVRRTWKIPMFFDGDEVTVWSEAENSIYIPFDIITLPFLLLSRYEEFHAEEHDEHGRFQFMGSLADRYKFVEIPLVDEYAMLLRRWLCLYFPDSFQAVSRPSRIVPTHDIDILYRFTGRWQVMKSIFGRDLLINRSFSMVRKSLKEYWEWKRDNVNDPYILAILKFAEMEHAAGLESVFFFKALNQGEDDASYDIHDTRLSRLWQDLWNEEALIGLHGSYKSADEKGRLCLERERLESGLDYPKQSVTHARQHYLRARFDGNPNSLDLWRQAGITDDYTLGFAERCGFRCGTCHPYRLYDVRSDCVTDITEHPLIVMDGTLFDYMKLSVEEAKDLAMTLKQRCFDVEGDFVFLWHNHTTTREFEPYYETVYPLLINH